MVKKIFLIITTIMAATAANAQSAVKADSLQRRQGPLPTIVRIGSSAVINLGLTEVLKSTVHEMRPDRSGNDSWPSRHTSWAFTAATVISHELYGHSAWWVVGSHTAANAIALQRTLANRHFPKDILGGAAIGIVSTELGYLLGDVIFPGSKAVSQDATDDWRPSFDATTAAIFPISDVGNNSSARTGYGASLRMSLPCSDRWGLSASFSMESLPLYTDGIYTSMLNGIGMSVGAAGHWELPGKRFGTEVRVMPGAMRNFGDGDTGQPGWSFTLGVSSATTYAVTPGFTLGAEAGYSLRTLDHALNALTVSVISRVRF